MYDRTDPLPGFGDVASLRDAVRTGATGARRMTADCRAAVDAREAEIGAWQALDWDRVEAQARELETRPDWRNLPLAGLPVGIKDIFDTVDFPTGYGSTIYEGHRPAADAAAVSRLRRAGAIIAGKTVSTEFAYWKPGKTRNPHAPARTPGGSSAGSAAAVAAGMVPLAIGSQTAASTIRPAAYCGIVGYKPTRGLISLAGVKALANSLDTVGVFARTVGGAGHIAAVLTAVAGLHKHETSSVPLSFSAARSEEWSLVDATAMSRFRDVLDIIRASRARVDECNAPAAFACLGEPQALIMAYEAARELAYEWNTHADRLSEPLRDLLSEGTAISAAAYGDACRLRMDRCQRLDELFGNAEFLLAPSTTGEAPLFEDGTGSPDMSRAWMLLDLPVITVPAGTGANDLPLGIQIAARPREDRRLLAAAAWLERVLAGDGQ